MDFNLPAEDDPRRLEVRDWLAADAPRSYRALAERGYAVPHWPAEWGGGMSAAQQVVLYQELAAHDAPRLVLAFVSIGLETRLTDIVKMEGGRPALAFIVAQGFNVVWTLILAFLLFGGILFAVPDIK